MLLRLPFCLFLAAHPDMPSVRLRPPSAAPAAARCSTGFATLLIVLACAALAHCTRHEFNNIDITGADYARDFSLTDTTGARRTLADYRGKVVVLFFGYTQCPDVCPATLAELARVRRDLGPDGARVQVLFATLDPARDTPQLLARYVPAFDPTFVGLYGSEPEIEATAREFRIFYQKVAGSTAQTYTLDHTAGSYVFDTQGHVRLLIRGQAKSDQIVADLRRLIG
jgi:protein SCO1